MAIPVGRTPEQAVEETIQSLIDQGELEPSLTRVDDPVPDVVAWFAQRKLGLVLEHETVHGGWVPSLTKLRGGRVLQRYCTGPTAEAAALRAQKRYEQEQ